MVISPNKQYRLAAFARGKIDPEDSASQWSLRVSYFDSAGAYIREDTVYTSASIPSTWTEYSGAFTTPSNAAKIYVRVILPALTGYLEVDNLSVQMVNPTYTTLYRKYYYAGSQRIGISTSDGVFSWILSDHLGSASKLVRASDYTVISEIRYKPWGQLRYVNGVSSTNHLYTGQLDEPNLGIMYYGARWYDAALGHFIQADTIIPGAGNPLAWDRYAYVNNNPINYTDPSGHFPWGPVLLVGGALVGGTIYGYFRYQDQVAINNNPELNRQARDQIGGTLVTQLTEVVSERAAAHNVSSTLINAVIRHESGAFERRYFGN